MISFLATKNLVLGSASPRRQYLLKEAGFDFEVLTADLDEHFSPELKGSEIPEFLSKLKGDFLLPKVADDKIIITADTIVWLNNKALNKPANYDEACNMLQQLSGNRHEVYTGVSITSKTKQVTFSVLTEVYFKTLSREEIDYYVTNFKPYDKAGAYGAQDWIGIVAIEKINGCYFNVMGLPVKELYEHLKQF